jgi:F-type H+-transporting ATPase subunit b
VLQQFAETSSSSPSLFEALGIDWKLLVLQGIAFLILVWILAKFVYPVMIKAIEDRRSAIEEGMQHAKKADEALQKAEEQVSELIAKARQEADDILARGQKEAKDAVTRAEDSAVARAERIVEDAHAQINNDVTAAQRMLRDETVKLVASATETIIDEKIDAKKDAHLIKRALAQEKE